ncbi:MAG: hypothetical protein JWN11_304 [Hyphomicrobiales bacterium]|nr:hypothetical protein [Hyphomicrobiales bacterium]
MMLIATIPNSARGRRRRANARLGGAFAGMLMSFLGAATAFGQELPDTLENKTTRLQGDQITFCLDRQSAGAVFDQKVGQAIADALLVKPVFVDAPSGFPIDAGGYLAELKIVMANSCDVLLGISLQPNFPYPDWATPTRAYADIPFVLAVTNPNYKSLADIPRTQRIGTALGSIGEYNFITYSLQQPEGQRWRRLPYADPNLMLKRVKDGTLGGIILWQPSLSKITNGDPAAAGLRIIPTDPVPASSVQVAALLSSRDSFLRSQIDQAVGSLIDDGTIQSLLDQTKFAGKPAAD